VATAAATVMICPIVLAVGNDDFLRLGAAQLEVIGL